jgi:tetratricopeptide (TPR) repeat protein
MRNRPLLAIVFALAAPAAVALPVVALAGGDSKSGDAKPSASASSSGKKYDPNNVSGISKYVETCVAGNAQYMARDFPAAIATYREAIKLAPKHPLAHYLVGEAQLAANNVPEAEASWNQAALVSDASEPRLRARILFVLADLKERQKKWDDAKAAWQVYNEFVGRYGDGGVGFAASGASRVQAIDTMTKLNAESDKVKQRIKETADGGVFTLVTGDASTGG